MRGYFSWSQTIKHLAALTIMELSKFKFETLNKENCLPRYLISPANNQIQTNYDIAPFYRR